jgi:hypothetical protein
MTDFAIIEIVKNLAPVLIVGTIGAASASIVQSYLKYRSRKDSSAAMTDIDRRLDRIEAAVKSLPNPDTEARLQNLEDIIIKKELE